MYELNNPTLVKSIRDSLTGYMAVRVLIGPRSDSQKTQYTGNDIISCKIAAGLFSGDPSVGNAVSRKLTLSVARKVWIDLGQEVKIIAQCRDTVGRTSETIPVGTFYIVSRKLTDDVYTLECYDRMYKANIAYPYSPVAGQYTVPSATVVQNVATAMNMSLSNGTLAAMVRPMDYPGVIRTADDEVEVYPSTCREMLRQAAAVNGGNFIISNDGKLKFVPIWQSVSDYIYSECESKEFPNGSDPESVTSVYSYMAVRIFVEGVVAARAYNTETLKNPFDVHLEGSLMQTQAQLDATAAYILSIIQGKNITGYNIKNAIINPAVELGDYFKSLPAYSLTHCVAAYNMILDSLYTADLSSPFTDEGGDTVWEA